MSKPKLILVGGFLGAGKTTLIARAAKELVANGMRVGLITNDQAADLVDTETLRREGMSVEEIAGGCFCCRFDDLVSAADRLVNEHQPDVLIGEPVGSCTDLSATVLQPLKEHYPDQFDLSPFSVLVDPGRLSEVLDPRMPSALHPSARYILRKQLEEADMILLNKVDLLAPQELAEMEASTKEVFVKAQLYSISALRGDGVEGWLERVVQPGKSGTHIVPVDYGIYAEGEAVLGWLNAKARLTADHELDWSVFCNDLLRSLRDKCVARGAEIVHAKLILQSAGGGYLAGNLTSNKAEPLIRGGLDSSQLIAELTVNARVEIAPAALESLVRETLRNIACGVQAQILEMVSLSPGRPEPTYRYESVV
jgi:Ni2+-binding GTPase involved in maturation of urease and hydrogenase